MCRCLKTKEHNYNDKETYYICNFWLWKKTRSSQTIVRHLLL